MALSWFIVVFLLVAEIEIKMFHRNELGGQRQDIPGNTFSLTCGQCHSLEESESGCV